MPTAYLTPFILLLAYIGSFFCEGGTRDPYYFLDPVAQQFTVTVTAPANRVFYLTTYFGTFKELYSDQETTLGIVGITPKKIGLHNERKETTRAVLYYANGWSQEVIITTY
jgi:hypothetical protein